MIASLRGHRRAHATSSRVVVETESGVGYLVTVSNYTFGNLAPIGSPIFLFIVVRESEEATVLYGFMTAEEQLLFESLCGVNKIGPTTALKVCGCGMTPNQVARAIAARDYGAFCVLRGIGEEKSKLIVNRLQSKMENAIEIGLL